MSSPRKQAEGIVEVYLMELNTPSIETRKAKNNLIDNISKALNAQPQPAPVDAMREALEACAKSLDNILKHWFISATITQCRSNVRRNETNEGERMLLVYSQDAEAALDRARTALAAAKEGK